MNALIIAYRLQQRWLGICRATPQEERETTVSYRRSTKVKITRTTDAPRLCSPAIAANTNRLRRSN
jgi:hypothetical protein